MFPPHANAVPAPPHAMAPAPMQAPHPMAGPPPGVGGASPLMGVLHALAQHMQGPQPGRPGGAPSPALRINPMTPQPNLQGKIA